MKPQLDKEERDELERFIREFPFTKTARAIKSAVDENNALKSQVEAMQQELERTTKERDILLEENERLKRHSENARKEALETLEQGNRALDTLHKLHQQLREELELMRADRNSWKWQANRELMQHDNLMIKFDQLKKDVKVQTKLFEIEKEHGGGVSALYKVLEWYADEAEEEARKFHSGVIASNIGELARQTLQQVKGDT